MSETHTSMCRLCTALCPIVVTVENGRAVAVAGDPDAPLFDGYTCPKGRALPEFHNGPQRLLHSRKRQPDGSFVPISSGQAIDEIAEKLSQIIEKHGPHSVAGYFGTGSMTHWPMVNMLHSFLEAIGSPMSFSPHTIDKPGGPIAAAAHGYWLGGNPAFEEAEAWILIGLNPIISKSGGFPGNNPARRLKEAEARGMKLIVIDPRATESTRRAHIHLHAKPGYDPAILAAMAHIIIAEKLYDAAFVAENVSGFEVLRDKVAPFTPLAVAALVDVNVDDLVEASRLFARSRYAGIGCGVGPSFSLNGALTDYLALCLMSLCGFWSREGDLVHKPHVLMPAYTAKAQALSPHPFRDVGHKLRVRGLAASISGLPTGALAEEILLEGKGQVRALINLGGNPMAAWPNQQLTYEAMNSLDLLVTSAPEMCATAKVSHYVIAPKLALETASDSSLLEQLSYIGLLRGIEGPYGRYAAKIIDPPEGSDVIEDWELIYELARRMGLSLHVSPMGFPGANAPPGKVAIDMVNKPSADDLFDILTQGSRVPLAEVRKYPHGALFDIEERVQPRDPDCTARLDIANGDMMADLDRFIANLRRAESDEKDYPFLLVGRRTNNIMNSIGVGVNKLQRQRSHNPAFLHPLDMEDAGLREGDLVMIVSPHGKVQAVAAADAGLRRGILSITHGFGPIPGEQDAPLSQGCNVNRLLSTATEFDPITGIPRMGAVPIRLEKVADAVLH